MKTFPWNIILCAIGLVALVVVVSFCVDGEEDRNFLFLFTTMFSHFHPISTL